MNLSHAVIQDISAVLEGLSEIDLELGENGNIVLGEASIVVHKVDYVDDGPDRGTPIGVVSWDEGYGWVFEPAQIKKGK